MDELRELNMEGRRHHRDPLAAKKPEPAKPAPKPAAAAAAAGSSASGAFASGPLEYRVLAKCLDQIGGTTKRLEITKYMSDFIRDVLRTSPDSLKECLYLSINKLGPDHDNIAQVVQT